MTIHNAEIEDLNKIIQLQRLCYNENARRYNDFNIQPLRQTLAEITEEFRNQLFLKVEDSGEIIGSVRGYCTNDTCYIGKLIVHPDHQNRGLGTKLMCEIESRFGEADRYELFTGHEDRKNLYLYRKLGYTVFREDRVNDSLTMIFLEKGNGSRDKEECQKNGMKGAY